MLRSYGDISLSTNLGVFIFFTLIRSGAPLGMKGLHVELYQGILGFGKGKQTTTGERTFRDASKYES